MARLRLINYDCQPNALPHVCMVCGERAVREKRKTFSYHPGWVYVLILAGLLVFVIVAVVLTKRRSVSIPLCERHRNHWLWRNLVAFGGLAGLIVLGIGVILLLSADDRPDGIAHRLSGWACGGVGLLALVWLIVALVIQQRAIRAERITDRDITLVNVSRTFIAAFKDMLAAEEEEDLRDRPRRRPRAHPSDEFYDPTSRRDLRKSPEEFEEDDERG